MNAEQAKVNEGALINDQLRRRGVITVVDVKSNQLHFYPALEKAAPALWDDLAKSGAKRAALRDFVLTMSKVRR